MIERPPITKNHYRGLLKLQDKNNIAETVNSINNEYKYWSDVKYVKLPDGILTSEELWDCVKASRRIKYSDIWGKYDIKLCITNRMERMCHEFDMNFGGSWGVESTISDTNKKQCSVFTG